MIALYPPETIELIKKYQDSVAQVNAAVARRDARLEALGAKLDAWAKVFASDVAGARAAINGLPAGTTANPFLVGCIALVEGRSRDRAR